MKRSTRWIWGALAVVAAMAVVLGWALLRQPPQPTAAGGGQAGAAQSLPWQVQVLADGSSRVMGLHLGVDTLAQVRQRAGDGLQVGLVARLGEVGALEALAEPFQAGPISGRLVMSFDVDAATLQRWREGAGSSMPMDGGVRRFELAPEHRAEAERALLSALSFVPTARLAEDDIRRRFGPPAKQQTLVDGGVQLWYPQQGVSAAVAKGQRGVIQYVAPRDAARLGAAAAPSDAAASQPR